jgi:hypothetical protein
MYLKSGLIVGAMFLATSAVAQTPKTATKPVTPGHQMQDAEKKGITSTDPGASEYAPGHLAKKKRAVSTGPGASEYAPGQVRKTPTTTGSAKTK